MLSNLLKGLFVFSILYDTTFKAIPITTARLGILGLFLVIMLTKRITLKKDLFSIIIPLLIFAAFSILQGAYSNDFTQTSRLLFFTLYSVIGAYFFVPYIRGKEELLWLFLIACSFQSIILISTFFTPSVKSFLGSMIEFGGNFKEDNVYRSFGLASTTGAALSVIQSIGVISSVYILKYYRPKRQMFANIVLLMGILCFLSSITAGRTGVIIGLVFFIFLLFRTFSVKSLFVGTIVFFAIFVLDIESLAIKMLGQIEGFSTEYFIDKWLKEGLSTQDNETLNAINRMKVPPIGWDTIIGTGKIVGLSGENASGNDSGYIQTYYSLGLILSICFYGGLFWYCLNKIRRGRQKDIMCLIVLIVFLIEYKEPFIFKYALPFFLFSLLYIETQKNNNLKNESAI
ncbi:hypothetical protein ACLCDV_00780 [Sphingobacterium sp. Lzh-3]|uniref:hypothetical protein n=1 Tax=Sphingobacterium sp. Lzh-3 TaxID=3382150 RepID=UPI00398C94BC